MSVDRLLGELQAADIRVTLDGESLHVSAPTGGLTPAMREQLQARKSELVSFLRLGEQLNSYQRAIVPLQPRGNRPPMFGVAGHGGDVFAYRALARHLGNDQPFYGLQPLGYDEGTVPMTRAEDIAEYFAGQIAAFHPSGTCTITGFCAGGTIAFELARRLATSGIEVRRLILFGAPFCTWFRPAPRKLRQAMHTVVRIAHHVRALSQRGVRRWPAYVNDRLQHLRERPPEAASDPLLLRRRAVERATLEAVRAYSPGRLVGHVDIMLPAASWRRRSCVRWGKHAASSTVYYGPDDCTADSMLLAEHAPVFAALVATSER